MCNTRFYSTVLVTCAMLFLLGTISMATPDDGIICDVAYERTPGQGGTSLLTVNWDDDVADWLKYNLSSQGGKFKIEIDNMSDYDILISVYHGTSCSDIGYAQIVDGNDAVYFVSANTYEHRRFVCVPAGDDVYIKIIADDDAGNANQTYTVLGDLYPNPARPSSSPDINPLNPAAGNSYTISWPSVSGAEYYELQEHSNIGWQTIYSGSGTQISRSNAAGTYYYHVRACGDCGCSSYSQERIVTVEQSCEPPDRPTSSPDISPDPPIANQNFTISWDPVSGADYYDLEEHTAEGWDIVYSGSNTSHTISRSEGQYWYHVRACDNDCGCSIWSQERLVSIFEGGPEAPILISPEWDDVVPLDYVSLYWQIGSDALGTIHYQAGVWGDDTPVFEGYQVTQDALIGNLTDHTYYWWRVRCQGVNAWSEWSETRRFYACGDYQPSATLLDPINGNVVDQPVTLHWSAVAGATEYCVEIKKSPFTGPVDNDIEAHFFPTTNQQELPQLDDGTLYYWRVVAENSCGWLNWCGAKTFNTANVGKSITVTYPEGGETFALGQGLTVTWTSTGISGPLELRFDYPGSSRTILSSTPNDGEQTITIPTGYPERSDWHVVLTDYDDDTWAVSGDFTLEETPTDLAYIESVIANRRDAIADNHVTISKYGFWRGKYDRFITLNTNNQDYHTSCLQYIREGLWVNLVVNNTSTAQKISMIRTAIKDPDGITHYMDTPAGQNGWPFVAPPMSCSNYNIPVFYEDNFDEDIQDGDYQVFFRFEEEFDFDSPDLVVNVTENEIEPPPGNSVGKLAVFDFNAYPNDFSPTLIDYTNMTVFTAQMLLGGSTGKVLHYFDQFSSDFWATTRAAFVNAARCKIKILSFNNNISTIQTEWQNHPVIPSDQTYSERIRADRALCIIDAKVGPYADYPQIITPVTGVNTWIDDAGYKHTTGYWFVYGVDKRIEWNKGYKYLHNIELEHETDVELTFSTALQMGPYHGAMGEDIEGAIIDYKSWHESPDDVFWMTYSVDTDNEKIEGSGIQNIWGDGLIIDSPGTINVLVTAPKDGVYFVKAYNEYLWYPNWGMTPSTTESIQLLQGQEHIFSFQVTPTTNLENFWFKLWRETGVFGIALVNDKSMITVSTTNGINYTIKSPIIPELIAPDGTVYKPTDTLQSDVLFYETNSVKDHLEKHVYIPNPISGNYQLNLLPDSTATSDSVFSIDVCINGITANLTQNTKIDDIPSEGYIVSSEGSGSIHGLLSSANGFIEGVCICLLNSDNNSIENAYTGPAGNFLIEAIPSGTYTLELQVPLGFVPVSEPTVPITIAGQDVEINFELAPASSGGCYSLWWWKGQFRYHQLGGEYAPLIEVTEDDITAYSQAVFDHFCHRADGHAIQIESVTHTGEPARPLTFAELSDYFLSPYQSDNDYQIKRSLRAILLNIASGRMSQLQVVSDDGITASQALHYLVELYLTGERKKLDTASVNLQKMHLCQMIDAGVIPPSTPNIMFKPDEQPDELPTDFALMQNYPNPFNPTTDIHFTLPSDGPVLLEVYNIMGQKVTTLFDGHLESGAHTVVWDGTDNTGMAVATGIYFYRLKAGEFSETRKMMLLK